MYKYSPIENRIFNQYVKVNRIVSDENPEELPKIEETLSLGLSGIKNVSKDNESDLRQKKAIIGLMVPIIKKIYNYRCHENKEDGGRRSPLGLQHVKNHYNINPSWDKMPSKVQCDKLMTILKNINRKMRERAEYLSQYSKLGKFVTTIPDIMSCPSRRVIKQNRSAQTTRPHRMAKKAAKGFRKEQLDVEQVKKMHPIQGGRKKKTRKKRKLSLSDYRKILKFYKLSIPKNASNIRKKGDKIIAKKFCSCIKKVRAKFEKEGIAIGICTKSVVNRKGYKRGKFKCKKRRSIKLYKGGSKYTKKNRINQFGGVESPGTTGSIANQGGRKKSKKIQEIIDIFKQYPDIFPSGYFRFLPATLDKHDKNGTLIYKNGVVLTYTKYKKTVNKYKKYKIKPGDVKLNQLVNKNQGNGKAKKIFLAFMKKHKDSNLLLDVLGNNKRAIKFYKKNGFKKIADTKFGKKMKGIVMLKITKKNRTRKKKN